MKEKVRKNKKLVAVALIILVVAIFGARRFIGKEEQSQFITSQVERATLVNSIQASGSVINAGQQIVVTDATGVVKNVFVKDGDKVKKGDKLAEIELDQEGAQQNASAYSSYISAANSLNSANNNYRSSLASLAVVYDEIKGHDDDETLEMKETRTKAEVANDNAYDSIKSAEAKLSSAWLDYGSSTPIITAPTSGEISDLMVAPGMVISPVTGEGGDSHKLFSIITGQEALVSISVSEIDISQIDTGQKVIIVVDAIADKTFTGKVVGLDRTGSVTQGVVNYFSLIALDTSDKALLPNMSVTVEIILSSKPNVLVVPAGAISQFQGQAIVRVLVNGQPQEREVEIGLTTPTQVEILNGLEEGETVITGQRQTGGEGESQFGGQSRGGFGGGALRPGGFGGGFRGGGSSEGDQH
ncbi:efflux RND transporter periplasmic adaptor subunit [Patescibacteria group bacterium]|nr:efflux RND transporter periplasmic adaptor subunit [Patescibacteria group bacterium]